MIYSSYFQRVTEGVEYLLALGSVLGLLGFVLGLIGFILGGSRVRGKMLFVMIASFVLMMVCGGYDRGLHYFRIY
ncbi:MAG: hypothetical protein GF383_01770 [Candidatus Lokiarchaeota archaeon]|nr:hypothetical protein [Candidatus Lokiarchaeota archaeon]MBD3338038.1 hypothetical protein [Candidatus Lokiarchaeota archaeon]